MNVFMLLVSVFLFLCSLPPSAFSKEETKDHEKSAISRSRSEGKEASKQGGNNVYSAPSTISASGNYGELPGGGDILRNGFDGGNGNSNDEDGGEGEGNEGNDQGDYGNSYPYPNFAGSSYPYPGIDGPDEMANGIFSNPFLGQNRRTSNTTPDYGTTYNGDESDSEAPSNGGNYFPSYGSQPGIYNSSPGGNTLRPNVYSSSPESYTPQPGIYSTSPGSYTPQRGMYVPQPEIYSSYPGGYGQQPGIYSPSQGSNGRQPGIYLSPRMYGQQPRIYSSYPSLRPAVDQGYRYPARGENGNRIGLRQPGGAYGTNAGNGYGSYPSRNVPTGSSSSGGEDNGYNGNPMGYGPMLFGNRQYPQFFYPGLIPEYAGVEMRPGGRGGDSFNQNDGELPYSQSITSTLSPKEAPEEKPKRLRIEDP